MKPAPFVHHAPRTVAEATAVLGEVGHDGKVLAGGQSLIPILNMRLASPAHLVDINQVSGLAEVTVTDDAVRVGALVRHAGLEHHEGAYAALPLLRQALVHVAHPVIRNRGTTVGSIILGTVLGGALVSGAVSTRLLAFDMPMVETFVDSAPEAAIIVIATFYGIAALFNLYIPDTGVDHNRHLGEFLDDRDVVRVLDPQAGSDRRAERHHGSGAGIFQLAAHDRVVGRVRQHHEPFLHEHLRRLEERLIVGKERALVADHFQLHPVRETGFTPEARRPDGVGSGVARRRVRQDEQ